MKSEIRNPKSERRPKNEGRSPRVFGLVVQSCTSPRSMNVFRKRIPTGFGRKAQGCRKAAILGGWRVNEPTQMGLRLNPSRRSIPCLVVVLEQSPCCRVRSQPRWGCGESRPFTQGSSFLATLGSASESRWDSGKAHSLARSCTLSVLHRIVVGRAIPPQRPDESRKGLPSASLCVRPAFAVPFLFKKSAQVTTILADTDRLRTCATDQRLIQPPHSGGTL